jgi:hypothetical protein
VMPMLYILAMLLNGITIQHTSNHQITLYFRTAIWKYTKSLLSAITFIIRSGPSCHLISPKYVTNIIASMKLEIEELSCDCHHSKTIPNIVVKNHEVPITHIPQIGDSYSPSAASAASAASLGVGVCF